MAHKLLEKITLSTINYLKGQISAGADLLQIFDSHGGVLNGRQYQEFSLKYISQICDALTEFQSPEKKSAVVAEIKKIKTVNEKPIIVFPKGAYSSRGEFGKLKCEVIGLDWNMPVRMSRQFIGNTKTLQGNADPCLLYADNDTIKKETERMLQAFGKHKYIANLGHGLYPDTEADKVKFFVNTIKEFVFENKVKQEAK